MFGDEFDDGGLTNQPRDNVTTYICKLGSIQFTFLSITKKIKNTFLSTFYFELIF